MRKSVTVWVEQSVVGGEVRLGIEHQYCDSNLQMACMLTDGLKEIMGQVARDSMAQAQPQPQIANPNRLN